MTSCLRKSLCPLSTAFVLSVIAFGCVTEETPDSERMNEAEGGSASQDSFAPPCPFDNSEGQSSAEVIMVDAPQQGFICPPEDQDWYRFSTGTDDRVQVVLKMSDPISPVQPTYTLLNSEGQPVSTPSRAATETRGIHCVEPGQFFLVVRDSGDAGQDLRTPYELAISTGSEPDALEPNNDGVTATPLSPAMSREGYIGCVGDVDVYSVELTEPTLLQMTMVMDAADFQPELRLKDPDGNLLVELSNRGSARDVTVLERRILVSTVGTHTIEISDVGNDDADPSSAYTLSIGVVEDLDPNEPNDEPSTATPVLGTACGPEWGEWQTFEGTFGVTGDLDWFRIPLGDCEPGILEAELFIDTGGIGIDAIADLEASLSLVRPHAPSQCETNAECDRLNQACGNSWDCAGYFNTCLPEGLCAGGGVCLPGGTCGAIQVQRRFDSSDDGVAPHYDEVAEGQPGGAEAPSGPRPHKVLLSTPLLGDDYVFLRVNDFGGNAEAPEALYSLRIRTRRELDPNEPSNVYTPALRRSMGTNIHRGLARRGNIVPVHVCSAPVIEGCVAELTTCNNGIDDDLDDLVDWPLDPGCSSPLDFTEQDARRRPQCADERDNDGDGFVDYPEDPDCIAASQSESGLDCAADLDIVRLPRAEDTTVTGQPSQRFGASGECGGSTTNEALYLLTVSHQSTITFRVTTDDGSNAFIYLLDSCQPNGRAINPCGTNSATYRFGPDPNVDDAGLGQYLVVIDGVADSTTFTLDVRHSPIETECDGVSKSAHIGGRHGGGREDTVAGSPQNGSLNGGRATGGTSNDNLSGTNSSTNAGNTFAGLQNSGGSFDGFVTGGLSAGAGGLSAGAGGLSAGTGGDILFGGVGGPTGGLEASSSGGSAISAGGAGQHTPGSEAAVAAGSNTSAPLTPAGGGDAPLHSGGQAAGFEMPVAGLMSGMGGTPGMAPSVPQGPRFHPHCCESEEAVWTEGYISYEADQDWYAYAHPCPGENCMVRILFEIAPGPVDHLFQIYTGDRLWFDTIVPVSELPLQEAKIGHYGGIGAMDKCLYAFHEHGDGNPDYLYTLGIRDLMPVRDFSTTQKYRFCIEKVADGCLEPPCRIVEIDGEEQVDCDVP